MNAPTNAAPSIMPSIIHPAMRQAEADRNTAWLLSGGWPVSSFILVQV